jgi:tetratricopeptide (TPR) repeat protein
MKKRQTLAGAAILLLVWVFGGVQGTAGAVQGDNETARCFRMFDLGEYGAASWCFAGLTPPYHWMAGESARMAGETAAEEHRAAELYCRCVEMLVLEGDAWQRNGALEAARYPYEEGLDLAYRHCDLALVIRVLEKKARVEYILRLLQEAAATFAEAARLQAMWPNDDRAAEFYLQAARCLFELADYGVAASYAYDAGSMRRNTSQYKKAGDALALGGDMALLAGDCKKARSYWKEAKNAYRMIEYRYTQPKCDAAAARERIESSLPQIP